MNLALALVAPVLAATVTSNAPTEAPRNGLVPRISVRPPGYRENAGDTARDLGRLSAAVAS